MGQFHATTIVAVKRGPDDICIGGDGQVTMGETAIMKNGQRKLLLCMQIIHKKNAWKMRKTAVKNNI